ncbi:SpdD protein [Streptomyces sp. x-80]|uniref:SpdD protein n=1 Tax=Streptomyces sp. x-80 TaxID=2789282 RepID=UPI00397FDB9C
MLTPKYPSGDTASTPAPAPVMQPATPLVPAENATTVTSETSPVPVPVAPPRRSVPLTPGALVTVAAGGAAAVLVVGTVLVSLLLATAITAASVALCAVVLRSLLNNKAR